MKKNWIIIFMLVLVFTSSGKCQNQKNSEITTNDVFATVELVDRTTDILLRARGIENVTKIKILEKSIQPMHVYQMLVATMDALIELEKEEGLLVMPKVVATPKIYTPADVKLIADMMLNEVHKILYISKIYDYPSYNDQFINKTPTDVFEKTLEIFVKMGILAGREEITPDKTYQQMIRAVSDVKSILSHIDPAQRFRIDAPVSPAGLEPTDVFKECLLIRKEINNLRKHFNMEIIPVPESEAGMTLHPADIFIQTQIIIAELNLLKMRTNTVSSTPLAIPVSDKTPGDVHQQAVMVKYLLLQVKSLQEMVNDK